MAILEVLIYDTGAEQLLQRIAAGIVKTAPVMRAIGEYIIEVSKQAFEKSASLDGTPWPANAESTILRYLDQTGGNYRKDGKLSVKGAWRVATKKPLIGLTRDLSRQWHYVATGESVTVYNTTPYARMQNFGGVRAEFPHLWGDIPARQFAPIDADGELDPIAAQWATQAVYDYLDSLLH